MKTAISLPDNLFDRAEQVAEHLGLNRSQLYAQALSEFLDKHAPSAITAAFDTAYSDKSSALDTMLLQLQAATLDEDAW
jgi:metal-responsive CopG/Arc/MetJ family transcriptional regulator